MRRVTLLAVVAVPMVLGCAVLLWLPAVVREVTYASEKGKAEAAREILRGEPFKVAENLSLAFQQVAKAVGPSVVNIESVRKAKMPSLRWRSPRGEPRERREWREFHGLPGEQFFERFFEEPFSTMPPNERFEMKGLGSGVIISSDGYILTNNHVVSDADEVEVKLTGGGTYTAKVVGTDPKTDLAVLKVDAKGLIPAALGDSDSVRVGELVLTVGSPFNLDHTVTQGIVSAKGRSNVGITDYEDFLQTDAAINPGNSGGPLVNLRGEVIGINTAIATHSGSNAGVGFAIPINMAKTIKDELISNGHVQRGWLGIAIQNLNPDLAKSFGYDGTHGVLVGGVNRGSPAEKSGLKDGDIITKYDGKPVEDITQLRQSVAMTKPSGKVEIEIFRSGKAQTLAVQVGEQETKAVAAAAANPTESLGLTVRDLTAEQARKLGLQETKGVVIGEVEPGSLAAHAGLSTGDAITSVNGEPVDDANAFHALLNKGDLKHGLRLHVNSNGMSHYVLLKEHETTPHAK